MSGNQNTKRKLNKDFKVIFQGKPDPDYLINSVFESMIQEIIGGEDNENRSSV